jgi:P27 family predicted phage terminase small subunit
MATKPPAKLTAPARKLWRELADELDLDAAGYLMLALLCQIYDRRIEARDAIAKEGAIIKDRWGQAKPSPWLAVERDQTIALQRAYHALGLDLEPNAE